MSLSLNVNNKTLNFFKSLLNSHKNCNGPDNEVLSSRASDSRVFPILVLKLGEFIQLVELDSASWIVESIIHE